MSETHRFVVPPEAAGLRLDRFLADRLPGASRTAAARVIHEGRVQVGGKVRAASHRLEPGDEIACEVPEPAPSELVAEDLPLSLLHEDEDIVVLDKAAGMIVHPGSGASTGTLVNALLHHVGATLRGIGGQRRPGIVHRLDKGTSGVMVVAKSAAAHARLGEAFAQRQVSKQYLAVVLGDPGAAGTVDAPIGRASASRTRMSTSAPLGRPSVTHWRTLEAFGREAALLAVDLETGRTHQVRVHLASIGHPLVGDLAYGGRRARGVSAAPLRTLLLGFPRPALHAHRLAFDHPRTGERVTFTAPPPPDFADLVRRLRDLTRGS